MIVLISEHRLKRVYADLRPDKQDVTGKGNSIVIGQIVSELVDVWTAPVGNVVMDDYGELWLERAGLGNSIDPCPVPKSYLAGNIESFQRVAQLHCEAGKLAALPRSQQWRFAEAEAALREWIQLNDPRCLDDPGSYWSELRTDEYGVT